MLWVSAIVIAISVLVIFLLSQFSKDVILNESVDTTMQVLENSALRIDNTLRLARMTASVQHQTHTVNRAVIEQLIHKEGILSKIRKTLPHASLTAEEVKHTSARQSDKSEHSLTTINGEERYTFCHPLQRGEYSLVAVCPADDINAKFSRMERVLLFRGGASILVLLCILYYVIAFHLRPLHRLADAAQGIAQGDLDTPIPDTRSEDETGRLQNSLSKMQRSLSAYLDVMQRKQATMNRQHAELNTAYGEVEVYERLRANFLHDMTVQMAAPVDSVCRQTASVCRDYTTMTKAEMARHQLAIMEDSETITRLLDQLLADRQSPTPSEPMTAANTDDTLFTEKSAAL